MNYVIHAPGPYVNASSGLRALYKLAAELHELGHDAVVAESRAHRTWGALAFGEVLSQRPGGDACPFDVPIIPDRWMIDRNVLTFPRRDIWPGAIHVYSDSVRVFPSTDGAARVRWMLNDREWPDDDHELRVTWSPDWSEAPRLCLDIIDRAAFYRGGDYRGEPVVYIGKGAPEPRPERWGNEITWDWPPSPWEVGEILRTAPYLVSFDTLSLLNHEARLCRTPVFFPRGGRIRDPQYGELGIAYQVDDLARAHAEVDSYSDFYDGFRQTIGHDVKRFIELCSEHFA